MDNKRRFTLSARREIVKTMGFPEMNGFTWNESDAEEEYEREKVLNTEINKRLLEMGLSPNSLKKT